MRDNKKNEFCITLYSNNYGLSTNKNILDKYLKN